MAEIESGEFGIPYRFSPTHLNAKTLAAVVYGWPREERMLELQVRPRWLFAACLGWTLLVVLYYYRQLFHIVALGPLGWLRDQWSLKLVVQDLRIAAWAARTLLSGSPAEVFPAAGEATQRAGSGLLAATLVILAALFVGRLLMTVLGYKRSGRLEAGVLTLSIGFGGLAYLYMLLAYLRLYRPAVVAGVVVLLAVAELVTRLHARRAARSEKHLGVHLAPNAVLLSRPDRPWFAVVLLAAAVVFVTALAPETEHDALMYHLYLPRLWLEAGRPVDLITERTSLYPLTWEMLNGAALVLGGPVGARLLQTTCFGLLVAAIIMWACSTHENVSPWLAAALLSCAPTILWAGSTANIDLAVTLYIFLAGYCLWRYTQTAERSAFLLAAVHLGLAIAMKYTALMALAVALPLLFVVLWRGKGNLLGAAWPVVQLALISLVIPLPWLLRAWHASGNPFFPYLYSVFGAEPPGRWSSEAELHLANFMARFGRPRTLVNYLRIPFDTTFHAELYEGALGPLFLALTPALVWARRNTWLLITGTLALGYFAIWASPAFAPQMRLLLPVVPFLALLAAVAATHLYEAAGKWARRILPVLMLFLLLAQFPPFTSLHEGDREGWEGWLANVLYTVPWRVVTGQERETDYLTSKVRSYGAWQYANRNLPQQVRILTFSDGDHYYSHRPRLWSESALAWPATWGADVGQEMQAFAALCSLEITHVLVDRRLEASVPPYQLAIIRPGFLEDYLAPVYEDAYFTLYRWKAACP